MWCGDPKREKMGSRGVLTCDANLIGVGMRRGSECEASALSGENGEKGFRQIDA